MGTAGDFLGEEPPRVVERQAGQAGKGLTSKVGDIPSSPGQFTPVVPGANMNSALSILKTVLCRLL